VFDAKTDSASAAEYFRYYGLLPQQQNMLQDAVRTGTYFTAILENCADFKDKVVMDVGAGSGILSFFAAMAGAKRVYAVEASAMSEHCQRLLDGKPAAEG
jgi:histone-arginine methyltransferase CARM1